MTENGLLLDGVLHKISEDLAWSYDRNDWLRPWTVRGVRADLTFEPFHVRAARTQLGVVASQVHQCFGTYRGWMATDGGDRVRVDGVTGWAEDARNRW